MKKIGEKYENGIRIDVYESAPIDYGHTVRVTGTKPRMSVEGKSTSTGQYFSVYVDTTNEEGYRGIGELIYPVMVGGCLELQMEKGTIKSNKVIGTDMLSGMVVILTKNMKYYLKEV